MKMKHYLLIHLFVSIFIYGDSERPAKIVGLVAGRNESAIIGQCLKALSLYTDAIVYLDDASEDNSMEIVKGLAQECKIARIISKKIWHRDEPGDKNLLLDVGRQIGGTHFIVLDADEMFTANCLKNNFLRSVILRLKPGENLRLGWIYLWQDSRHYRVDELPNFTNHYKNFIFCDDGKAKYESGFIHTHRSPFLKGPYYQIPLYWYGVLHFEFMNWRNQLIKNAWYQCLERVRNPNRPVEEVKLLYVGKKMLQRLEYKEAPADWLSGYHFFDESVYMQPDKWRARQIADWFTQYGKPFFAGLDIWSPDMQAAIRLDN